METEIFENDFIEGLVAGHWGFFIKIVRNVQPRISPIKTNDDYYFQLKHEKIQS